MRLVVYSAYPALIPQLGFSSKKHRASGVRFAQAGLKPCPASSSTFGALSMGNPEDSGRFELKCTSAAEAGRTLNVFRRHKMPAPPCVVEKSKRMLRLRQTSLSFQEETQQSYVSTPKSSPQPAFAQPGRLCHTRVARREASKPVGSKAETLSGVLKYMPLLLFSALVMVFNVLC